MLASSYGPKMTVSVAEGVEMNSLKNSFHISKCIEMLMSIITLRRRAVLSNHPLTPL